jgi:hypothetical protein
VVGTKRTEAFEGVVNLVPEIVSSNADVAPWDGRHLGEQAILDVDAPLPDEADGPAQIDGVPQDDGVGDEVEPAGAVGHGFSDAVPQLAELVQEDGASEGMAGFALIEVSMCAAAQGGVQEPIADYVEYGWQEENEGRAAIFLRMTDGGTRPAAIEAQSRSISSQFSSTMARLAVPPRSGASGA